MPGQPGAPPLVSVVVPTYNERENLAPLFRRLDAAMTGAGIDYEIVLVDDDSPDGTWERAQELAAEYPVNVVRRTDESGRASAVFEGFRHARDDVFVVMDSDLQHPPETIPDLVRAIEDGADVAVGSRFTEGGSPGDFGPLRRLISWGADVLARVVFRSLRPVADIQSGLYAVRRDVVEGPDLQAVGLKNLIEILALGDHDEVVEVGYTFQTREAGESNIGIHTIVDYLRHLAGLAWRSGEATRFARFLVVGGGGALVNLGSLAYLHGVLGVHYLLAGAAAIELGLLWNFSLNALWTFRDRVPSTARGLARALGRDHAVRAGGILLNLGILALLAGLAGVPPVLAQAVGIVVATAWNFGGNQVWTWEP